MCNKRAALAINLENIVKSLEFSKIDKAIRIIQGSLASFCLMSISIFALAETLPKFAMAVRIAFLFALAYLFVIRFSLRPWRKERSSCY